MADRTVDVVVVGAGVGGAAAAMAIARAGRSVLLVDRCAFPRRKVCGGCLSSRAVAALERIGLPRPDVQRAAAATTSVRICAGRLAARFAIPPRFVIERGEFDRALVAAAIRNGVAFRDGTSALIQDRTVRLKSARGEEVVKPTAVIVADGLSGGALREDARFGWRIARRALLGVGAVLGHCDIPDPGEGIAMACAPHGYVGFAHASAGRVIVAAAVRPHSIRRHGLAGALASIAARAVPDADFQQIARACRGVPHLARRRVSVEADACVFVLGDAAGYVEPFTGEGMTWAVEHAEAVVPNVLASIDGRYRPGAWSRALRTMQRRQQRSCRIVGALLRSQSATHAALWLCGRMPELAHRVAAGVTRESSTIGSCA